jgi:hypothetical protein
MKNSLSSQRGAVLAFSLLMLLLITLLGVNMVQQNKMQYMMAENTQTEVRNLTQAENLLKLAEEYIASQRFVTWPMPDPPVYECKNEGGTFQQLLRGDLQNGAVIPNIVLPPGSSVEIAKTICINSTTKAESDCLFDTLDYCAYFYDPATFAVPTVAAPSPNLCDTELYTITTTIIDEANNERAISSNYAVRCDN